MTISFIILLSILIKLSIQVGEGYHQFHSLLPQHPQFSCDNPNRLFGNMIIDLGTKRKERALTAFTSNFIFQASGANRDLWSRENYVDAMVGRGFHIFGYGNCTTTTVGDQYVHRWHIGVKTDNNEKYSQVLYGTIQGNGMWQFSGGSEEKL